MTCRLFDDRKRSAVLRHFEFERIFGFGDMFNGDTHAHFGVTHLGFRGPVPSVAVHRAFRVDRIARVCEFMVGVNLFVRIISQEGDALAWPHRPGAFRVARDEEPARVPFALFRGCELASGHRSKWFGLALHFPGADVIVEILDLWPGLRWALRRLCLDGCSKKHHANREHYCRSIHNRLLGIGSAAGLGPMATRAAGGVRADTLAVRFEPSILLTSSSS